MGTDQFQPWPEIEEAGADHLEDIDGVIEEITSNHGQLVFAGSLLAGRIGGMDKKRHAEIERGSVNRFELRIVKVNTAHVGRDVTPDEAIPSHAADELLCRRARILHRQKSPRLELRVPTGNLRRDGVVEFARRLHSQRLVEVVVDEGSRQRQDGSFDTFSLHSLNLARQIEKGLVETEVHPANIDID